MSNYDNYTIYTIGGVKILFIIFFLFIINIMFAKDKRGFVQRIWLTTRTTYLSTLYRLSTDCRPPDRARWNTNIIIAIQTIFDTTWHSDVRSKSKSLILQLKSFNFIIFSKYALSSFKANSCRLQAEESNVLTLTNMIQCLNKNYYSGDQILYFLVHLLWVRQVM